jgi:hypothetical protein
VHVVSIGFKAIMNIEFHYRTYSIYGGSATLNVAGKWLSPMLRGTYGDKINSVLIEFCARNVSPPRKTLEQNHERFEKFLSELPFAEFQEKGTELRFCSRLIKHYHDEIDRDSQVLSLKIFKTTLNKSVQLLESSSELIADLKGFDSSAMATDIQSAIEQSPKSLVELSELYLEQQKA